MAAWLCISINQSVIELTTYTDSEQWFKVKSNKIKMKQSSLNKMKYKNWVVIWEKAVHREQFLLVI